MQGDPFIPEFILRALFAGIGVAIVAGPLGAFVVWRRMAYFGEALAHSALLGVVLGVILGVMPWLVIFGVCSSVAIILYIIERYSISEADAAIGMIAQGTLAFALVILAFLETERLDLFGYLFGDILAVTNQDIFLIYGAGSIVLIVMYLLWQSMLSVVVNEDIARVEGVNVTRTKIIHLLLLALVVSTAMKIVGVLLVVSMLIIPPSVARLLARSPESMAAISIIVGIIAVGAGLWSSFEFDTPAGPSIVVASIVLYVLSMILRPKISRSHPRRVSNRPFK
jgi:zinc transport system permease protein